MNERITNDAYVRKFSFRPFTGIRKGRLYRLWSISWQWWAHEWDRSRAVKILFGFQIFTLVITNLFLLAMKDFMLLGDPTLTTTKMLENTLIELVRGLVSFQTSISGEGGNGGDEMDFGFTIGGMSFFILILCVLIGSGLISDDMSNKTNEIYYSKLEKHEYILGKFGAFFLFGNIIITLPYVLEFFLLFIGLGGIDFIQVLPILVHVIVFTELISLTYASIILAFSSMSSRRLYAGLAVFMLIFLLSMIIPFLANTGGGEVGFQLLFDVLTMLLLSSYILNGETLIEIDLLGREHLLDLADGVGIESWAVLGIIGLYIILGLLLVIFQVYRRHSN